MGKVVLIGSQKREIGKTIICMKLGINISESGKKVLLMDLSSGKIKIAEYLKVNQDIIYDIKDVLDTTCSLDQAVIEINNNLSLLPSPRLVDKLNNIKIEAFNKLISEAKDIYDIIIVDVDKINLSYIDYNLINHVIIINNNDFSSVKEFNGDKNIANNNNIESILSVINKYNKKNAKNGTMMNSKDIQKMTNMNMDIIIEETSHYASKDYDFVRNKENNSFNKAIENLTGKILS